MPVWFTIHGWAPDEAALKRMLDALFAATPNDGAWSVSPHDD